jgi:hypothetical protein
MKRILLSLYTVCFLASLPLYSPEVNVNLSVLTGAKMSGPSPQSVKKPKYDYMSTILSRSTRPLGLKENITLNNFLNQPSIKWAVRAGERHILQ